MAPSTSQRVVQMLPFGHAIGLPLFTNFWLPSNNAQLPEDIILQCALLQLIQVLPRIPNSNMAFRIDGQDYTQYQAQVGCALKLYLNLSDDTLGSILATMKTGLGSSPLPCGNFVRTLQRSQDVTYSNLIAGVRNDEPFWEREARRVYRDWMDAHSQLVQR